MARILVFEDDRTSMVILLGCLAKAGHEVQVMQDGSAVTKSVRDFQPDLVITDIMMPGMTGGGVYQAIRQEFGPNLPIIVSSATSLHISRSGDPLLAYCPKPLEPDRLLETIQNLITAKPDRSDPPPGGEKP